MQRLSGMSSSIENEQLCLIQGLDYKEAAARSGRNNGVSDSCRIVLGEVTADASRTTSIYRAWMRSANLLTDICRAKYKAVAHVVAWKLLQYLHPQLGPAMATQPQLAAMR